MLASTVTRSRQHNRSFCLSIAETNKYAVSLTRSDADELVTRVKRLTAKLLSAHQGLSLQGQHRNDAAYLQRRCQSEVISNHVCHAAAASRAAKHTTSGLEAARQHFEKEGGTESTTNDVAIPSKSSCIGVTHVCDVEPQNTYSLQHFPSVAKRPAEVEWERLWYSGVSLAFSKIAHYFPELSWSTSENTLGPNISEPTLPISHLKAEDRPLFEVDERKSTQSFVPRSEEERLTRLRRSRQVVDDSQRKALLLGLPTFDEYLARKSREAAQSQIDPSQPSKRSAKRQARLTQKKEKRNKADCVGTAQNSVTNCVASRNLQSHFLIFSDQPTSPSGVMTHERKSSKESTPSTPATHRPLVVGLTKPQSARSTSTMASSSEAAALNKAIEENVKTNTKEAAPAEETPAAPSSQKPKKEKAPKQPKPQKVAAPVAPTSPALIDLRVGHILRAIAHPNADSLYVSTIAMGDPEGTEHTQVDEETGKVVRTVCSGLNGLVPLEEMQDRKIVVVANLKPVNMRSIKSAAMVLAASPKQPEGADPHAPDRVVELVTPPAGSEAGDKVYFEGWQYGEGKGPEKVLNPKKKQWEAIQPGFYTSDDLVVGFDASSCEEVEGSAKGNLVVEGKGPCTVKTLKGAVVR